MSTTSQAAAFLDRVSDISDSTPNDDGEMKAQVPFSSALKLTYDQEQRMVEHALRRIDDMELEQGRVLIHGNANWFEGSGDMNADRHTFMGRRSLYELNYQNKVGWRKFAFPNSIYAQSNLTAPFSRRIVRQMTAQAVDYYFGTDPWFAAYPMGGQEEDLAEYLDTFAQFKTERSGLKSCMAKAIEGAFVRGEAVVKTVWETDEQTYEQFAQVLTAEDGSDIFDVNGDWITDKDRFTDEEQSQVDTVPGPNAGKPIPGSMEPTGRRVLRKDMMTEQPDNPVYTPKTITRRRITFRGAKSDVVYWQDILIPEKADHVQRGGADIVAHLSDMPVIRLIDLYQRRGLLVKAPSEQFDETKKALDLLRRAASGGGQSHSAVKQPRADIGETQDLAGGHSNEPKMEMAEVYLTFDANEDGQTEEVMLVIDRKNRIPVFYDYLANVTPDGERPFDVVRIQPVEGRWHGIGAMAMFEKSQRTIDLLLNRWNVSQGASGRVTFWKPSNTLEGDRDPHLALNFGQTFTLKPDKTMEDTLGFVNLPEIKSKDIQEMMEYMAQLIMNEAGVASVNDGAAAGMDTAKLATGVRNLESNNHTMASLYWGSLFPSLVGITRRNIVTEFANTTYPDVLKLFGGDHYKAGVLMAEDLQDLEINVNILMTKYRNQQVLQSSLQAINSAQQYFMSPVPVQEKLTKLYQQVLRALQIDDPDEIIEPLEPQAQPTLPTSPDQGQPQLPAAPVQPHPEAHANGAANGDSGGGAVQPVLGNKFLWRKPGK